MPPDFTDLPEPSEELLPTSEIQVDDDIEKLFGMEEIKVQIIHLYQAL